MLYNEAIKQTGEKMTMISYGWKCRDCDEVYIQDGVSESDAISVILDREGLVALLKAESMVMWSGIELKTAWTDKLYSVLSFLVEHEGHYIMTVTDEDGEENKDD